MAYAPIRRCWRSCVFSLGDLLSELNLSPKMARLHVALRALRVRWQMAVMPAQFPALTSAAGHSQEPPTATTLGSASQVAALASPTPPVGQNRTFGNGPPSARRPLMPPACSAGKNFATSRPYDSASISSEAVAMPGANGKE